MYHSLQAKPKIPKRLKLVLVGHLSRKMERTKRLQTKACLQQTKPIKKWWYSFFLRLYIETFLGRCGHLVKQERVL